jgi:hypothetical protein
MSVDDAAIGKGGGRTVMGPRPAQADRSRWSRDVGPWKTTGWSRAVASPGRSSEGGENHCLFHEVTHRDKKKFP